MSFLKILYNNKEIVTAVVNDRDKIAKCQSDK